MTIWSTRPRERKVLTRLGAQGRQVTAVGRRGGVGLRRREPRGRVRAAHRLPHRDAGGRRFRARAHDRGAPQRGPDGPPSALLGFPLPATVEEPAGVNPVGGWAADVRVLLAPKAQNATAETSIPSETQLVKEDGRRRWDAWPPTPATRWR